MIVERSQEKRLGQYKAAITSCYMSDGKKYLRSTDHSRNDNVSSAVLVEKIYYVNGRPVKKITGFDPRMQYTYLAASPEQKEVHCPNCGYVGNGKEMAEGCPACGATFNVEYSDKELGAKYHFDQIVNGKGYKVKTLLVDMLVSFFLSFFVLRFTGRTFNIYDIGKVIIGTAVLTLILYFFFYQVDAYIVSGAARREAEKKNREQKRFWEAAAGQGIEKKVFFNNLMYELRNHYYGGEPSLTDVIDFDVVDFLDFDMLQSPAAGGEHRVLSRSQSSGGKFPVQPGGADSRGLSASQTAAGGLRVRVQMLLREIRLRDGQITEKTGLRTVVLERKPGPVRILLPGMNLIKCRNCGASVDATAPFCSYCGTPMLRYQEWSMV
ncbi:MAG: zinc-ribbon domain-containing protein [Eubacterium sp.]|nr:zinc-ribbon domain-containing protein [Eubacterium sp.]